ncbi:T9SS type A sorting domain-containing protein [candidate division KSB1 bacterium]|nr:T9SS type A sorting domain-containing protein [candidate division KSB1 bacterium]
MINFVRKFLLPLIPVILITLFSSCFTILTIEQPKTARTGEQISVYLEVRTEVQDENPHYGIVGLLIPDDWKVDSVYYAGDFGPDYCFFLPADSADGDLGGKVDFWADTLETRFPSGDSLSWRVYQAKTAYSSALDTGYVDLYVNMTIGQMTGEFPLGYLVTNAALDFSDASFYSLKLKNLLQVTDGTGVKNSIVNPHEFYLSQNYPNPFNSTTTVEFYLAQPGQTQFKIFNLMGEEVATLMNCFLSAGQHQVKLNATGFNSGIYYYCLNTQHIQIMKKFIYIK